MALARSSSGGVTKSQGKGASLKENVPDKPNTPNNGGLDWSMQRHTTRVRKGSESKSDIQGHSMSLVMVPFDWLHTISYLCSIATMWFIVAPFLIFMTYFPKYKEVT